MDIFDNQASEFTFVRSYARWMDDANKRESWPETVERVVKFLAEERGDLIPEKTLKKIGTHMLDLAVMPSMRLTWTAGNAARKDNTCIYNCFSRGTEFITDRGVLSFNDFDNGDKLTVLTHLGNWKDATVKCFGKQKIDSIELWRGSNSKSVFVEATENHNWILKDGTRTTSIDVGDLLYHAPQLQFDYDNSTPEEKLYWCYGYVYGDGTNVKYDGEYRYSMVRLCNKDSSFKKRFEEMGFKTSTSHSLNGDFMAYTGSYLKTLPSLENDPVNLISAFVNGLLAADGTKKRNNGKTRYVSIQATGKESCDFLKAALPMCGFYITRIDDFSNQTTNLGKRGDLTLRFIIDDKTCQHSNCIWKVKSIQKAVKEENVWCLTVDCDESFVLPFGVSTGNCAFTPIDSVESFAEILFILMCGCGIAFSVTKEHISKLPSVPSIDTMHQIPASIEDSREGWADSVKFLMNNLFRGRDVHFDYSRLRPEGARLHTMGGRSSGPAPLINLHTFIRNTFISAQGRSLTSLECHDIANQIAEAVIVGGVRRSSEMSLSDLNDQAMATAKVPPFPPRRYMANNSAVYYEKPTAVEFLKEWSILASSGSGERGIFNLDSARKKCPSRRDGKKIQGVNPCISGNSWIQTSSGPATVHSLVGKPFKAMVEGSPYESSGFFKTGEKECYRLYTKNGYSLDLTDDHRVRTSVSTGSGGFVEEWKEAKDLKDGDLVCLSNNRGFEWEGELSSEEGWLLGYFVGDGCFSKPRNETSKRNGILRFWGDDAEDLSRHAYEYTIRNIVGRADRSIVDHENYLQVSCVGIADLAEKSGINSSKDASVDFEANKSSEFYEGFLRGIFDADGSVQGSLEKGVSIRLSQSDIDRLEMIQRLLLRLGIVSTIYRNRRPAGYRSLPDGNGGMSEYKCKSQHELVISNDNIVEYSQRIGFLSKSKASKLKKIIASYKRTPNKELFVSSFQSLESIGKISVYDATVETVHEFDANGIRAHNCGEIMLRARQFCNLSEVVCKASDDLDTLLDKVETATWLGAIQSTFTDFPYLSDEWKKNCEEERLMGVSLTGICDCSTVQNTTVLNALRNRARKVARRASKLLRINYAAAITCGKPSGTVSQLVNSSSGIHPRYSKFYIRRYRISKMDPLYHMMKDQGVNFVPDNGCDPDDPATLVCEFPVKSPDGCITRADMSAMDQLNLYKMFQEDWSEHNMSCTIYVKDHEWFEVGNWVYQNWDIVNGLSFMPYDNSHYSLAPYEEIDEATYLAMAEAMPNIDYSQLTVFETEDRTEGAKTLACSGGSCELQ